MGNFLFLYLIHQHMIPIALEAVPAFREGNYFSVLLSTLHLAVPAAYFWLNVFLMLFHVWLNLLAEITYFSDRRFYQDWWNAEDLGEYWRKWNSPIHNFLIRHVYYPFRRRNFSQGFCLFITFTVSAIFHEYVMIGIFAQVNLIAFTIMMVNIPLMVLQRKLKGIVTGNLNNILYWLMYIVLAQPFGILFVFYQVKEG